MTQTITRAATDKIIGYLTSETGLSASLAELSDEPAMTFDGFRVHASNAAPDLAEKTVGAKYPAVYVYCDRLFNTMTEKFRRFSGRVQAVVDVRLTLHRLETLSETVELYVDAVVDVLARSRGDWGDGLFYAGKYEVVFAPVKHGGKNFLATAKVVFDIEVSK